MEHPFEIGDIVRLKPYVDYISIYPKTDYIVTETHYNKVSNTFLIRVECTGTSRATTNYLKASSFKLVEEKMNSVTEISKVKMYIVTDKNSNHIIDKFSTRVEAETYIKNLLNKFPTLKYNLFILAAIGSLPEMPVNWEVATYD